MRKNSKAQGPRRQAAKQTKEAVSNKSRLDNESNQPRPGSKQALLIDLLRRAEGARLDEMVAATAWLPHTARAALTGLRKKGLSISREKDGQGRTFYRIAEAHLPPSEAVQPAAPES